MDRRNFLKSAGIAGAATISSAMGLEGPAPAAAQAVAGQPKRLTFATLRRADGYGLGVRTSRGVLDVAAAEQDFHANAPTTINAVLAGQGDLAGLAQLVQKADASAAPERYFIAADKPRFGPCVTNPEKIVCVGLNYARTRARPTSPFPKLPILFNKFNNALNRHRGTVRVSAMPATKFDYEAELVIVMGRRARNVSEAEALSYVFGYCTGNDFTARDLQMRTSQWMIGKTCDGFAPLGPYLVTADQVDPDQPEDRVHGQRRGAPVLEHQRHGVQLRADRQLRLQTDDAGARRHHLHRHAGGRDLGLPEGEAGVAQARRQASHHDRETGRPRIQLDVRPGE